MKMSWKSKFSRHGHGENVVKIWIFTMGIVKMSWKSQLSWKYVWNISGKKIRSRPCHENVVKMSWKSEFSLQAWWKCRENPNCHENPCEILVEKIRSRPCRENVVKMSWKSEFHYRRGENVVKIPIVMKIRVKYWWKKLDLDRVVKMWWKCHENLNFHYRRGENVVKIQIFTMVVKICSENSWWKSVVKMCSVNLWCKYVVKICLHSHGVCSSLSVRPSIVKICSENVVKRCRENFMWCKLWCKCSENVVKM